MLAQDDYPHRIVGWWRILGRTWAEWRGKSNPAAFKIEGCGTRLKPSRGGHYDADRRSSTEIEASRRMRRSVPKAISG